MVLLATVTMRIPGKFTNYVISQQTSNTYSIHDITTNASTKLKQPTQQVSLASTPQNSQEGSLLWLEHLYCMYAESCDPQNRFQHRACPDSHTTKNWNSHKPQTTSIENNI